MSAESNQDTLRSYADEVCRRAVPAARRMAMMSSAARVAALLAAADALAADADAILAANARDLAQAQSDGLSAALIDRLCLDAARLQNIVADVRAIAALPDPVGVVLEERAIAQGIQAQKVAVPLGVVAIIFESRPNVTVDTAALCVKSGNACILRGGKEAQHSNQALASAFRRGLEQADTDTDAVQLIQPTDRRLIEILLAHDEAIALCIPRGGEALIRAVIACSRVPVIKHDKGVCSVYVHAQADLDMARRIIVNAKCQRPGVCNAIENCLVDAAIAPRFLPMLAAEMAAHQVEVRADARALPMMPGAIPASEEDWSTEYLELILAVAVVDDVAAAIAFTHRYGSHHSDGIITADTAVAERYLAEVDSACVYHNASTRFTDGNQFGFGAEVGISTNRIHARGPMGLRELCTYKWICRGTGQVRP